MNNDTICAIASPPGQGAISVIRLSGAESFNIINHVTGNGKFLNQEANTIHRYKIYNQSEIIDDVLIAKFNKPKSYTGEDIAEISCHGSTYIQQRLIEVLINNGARLAQPGEFTLKAFLNGKLDLSQAEAVADLIHSSSKSMHQTAINQMRGGFSKEISLLRHNLLQFASLIELELDFSEEDVEFANRVDLKKSVLNIRQVISQLVNSFQFGNVIKNGVPVAIVGKPNVGKSTLLNALLNEEKAIVSEIPGTTRDSIEDIININGIAFRFIDTAGIRHTSDIIENKGIERTFENIRKASIVLLLVDATDNFSEVEKQVKGLNLENGQHLAIIFNKIDKANNVDVETTINKLKSELHVEAIMISAKKNLNIVGIHNYLVNSIQFKENLQNDTIITNVRHYEALAHTLTSCDRVLNGIDNSLPSDLLSQDIREMLYHLGTITGEITTDEILGNIFKNFCIGK